jgi:hypothetical protein
MDQLRFLIQGIHQFFEAKESARGRSNLSSALQLNRDNPTAAEANVVNIYAWNESDAGGWLVPTLSEGMARLDALRKILRPAGKPGR